MASPQAEAVKDQMRERRELAPAEPPSLEDQRLMTAALFAEMATEPDGVTYEEVNAGGVPAMWIVPEGSDDDRVLQYVHGGGYVIMSMHTHRRMVAHIAKAAGVRALSVDYRLAPEHPHPAAVDDSVTAYRWLLSQGFAPERLGIAGDSAGGGLTIATLVALRDQGVPLPAAAVPISPWVDLEATGETMTTRADVDLIVSAEVVKVMADQFLAGQDARHPLAAPLHADLTGLPPLYIQVGDEETLLDDSLRIAAKARDAGVDVTVDVFPEMQHVFQLSAGNMPEADEAIVRIGAYLQERLGA